MKFDDTAVIARRKAFLEKQTGKSADDLISQWPLYAGEVPIARLLAVYECFKMTINVPGHIAEFGVWKGGNFLFLAKLLKLFSNNSMKMVVGFDSWKGLSEFAEQDGNAKEFKGMYIGHKESILEAADVYGLRSHITLVDGLIENTLPSYLEENPHHMYSMLYLDTDLYKSTKFALEQFWPRLAPGGIAVFDEGYDDQFPGEGAAVNEFFQGKNCEFGSFPFSRQPMLWVRKNG